MAVHSFKTSIAVCRQYVSVGSTTRVVLQGVSDTIDGRVLAIDAVDLRGLGLVVVVWASGDIVYRSLIHIGDSSQVCSFVQCFTALLLP